MADTAEMRRLMTHAADLLDACDPMATIEDVPVHAGRDEATHRAAAEVAAIATASTVLRMVAAAMVDDVADPK